MKEEIIRLGHGSGGLLTSKLIRDVVLRYFDSKILGRLEDAAELPAGKKNLAFTTDSYVVDPIFFPGGDIGKLAVCGTINDLAVKGAIPKFLSFALIIEEGFPVVDLERILRSAARTAHAARVSVVCGDTKVVDRGKADKIFITTSGIGVIKHNVSTTRIRHGDRIIVSGTIGDHGIAVMNERLKLGLQFNVRSDLAALHGLIRNILRTGSAVHFMRDPTRGGVVSVLNEAIEGMHNGIMISETALPIKKQVRGASEILGLDPLYIANEGKIVAFVDKKKADEVLRIMRAHPLGRHAAMIGEVVRKPVGVWMRTRIGGTHPLMRMEAEGLPRIC
ncbi:MAG: hydrogenase expression/formation protein HypE [candidate division WOR-3 bacterium]|nr:MAG: hydrogenase expression/formation protein HypE [candidate division WOR-3 bacterium]